ncbi:gp03 [Burkholderia pseudomallei]|nr:gp03 [Burkholderia pseudomallei]
MTTTENSRADALTERDYDLHEHEQGLYRKFDVRRVDGSSEPGGKHHDCEYFVLDMTHDQHARAALRAYADACESTHPELSADLIARYALAPIEQPAQADARVWLTAHTETLDERSAREGAMHVNLTVAQLYDAIEHVLSHYRLSNWVNEHDDALGLVDRLCDHDARNIESGQNEIRLIVDEIYNEVLIPAAFAATLIEQPAAAPIDEVTCARMGHGVVAIGDCFSPELQEPGIIFMELPEQRDIGLDTGDVFPEGSRAPSDKMLAYISFANPNAIDQTISVLQRIKAKHFPVSSPIYPQGVMGIPPYSPPGSGQSQATSALTWNAPTPAEERAASWHCEDPVQICSAQCDSCAKQARAALKAIIDERAECIAWANANGFTKYHESMCAAWEERARRAAQQLSAEIRELKVKLGSYEREREDQIRYLAAQSEEIAGLKQQLAHADVRVGLTATVIQKCIDSCAAEYLEDVTGHPEDAAYCQGITDCIDALNRLKTADWSAILAAHSGQSEPETATVARIEQLRKALFESRDAMRVMSNWAKKPDPAGHSWAVRMVDRANAALNGETEPRSEVMLFADNDERDEFIRVCQDFDDDGETCVDYELLMKWASNGLLDCDHFTITKKGRAAIDAARTGASS